MEHKVPFILCVIAGIIFIQVAWIGSIGFFQYLDLIATIPALADYAWLVEILLYVLTTIAGLGGIAVIAGGFLLTRSKETTGKLIIGIAVGMSLIGVIIKTVTAIWLTGGTGVLDIFLLEATITEWVAVVLTIMARRMAKDYIGYFKTLIRNYFSRGHEVTMSVDSEDPIQQAVALIQRGQYEQAVKVIEPYVKINPDSIAGWYNLGIALAECERDDDALKAYDEALAIDNEIFEIWFNKGTLLYNMADFKGAKECYERAVEIDPNDAEAWNNLGNCHSRLGEGQQAIQAYTRAVALKPDYAEAFYNKANAHFIEEEDERAIAYGELAMELNPKLREMVEQWIHVARDRIRAVKSEEEHKRRQRKLKEEIDRGM